MSDLQPLHLQATHAARRSWRIQSGTMCVLAVLACLAQPSRALRNDVRGLQGLSSGTGIRNTSFWVESPQACPAPWTWATLPGERRYSWVEEAGRSCATLVPNSSWIVPDPALACTYPSWRLGPGAALVTLYSLAHAQALAAALSQGQAAWVGLRATTLNGTQPLRWLWSSTDSSYALSDASAWEGSLGGVPAPVEGLCGTLLPNGRLAPANCTQQSAAFAACAIPVCACSSPSSCSTSSLLPGWQGLGCVPYNMSLAGRVNSAHVFAGSADRPANSYPPAQEQLAVGCGALFNNSQQASAALSLLDFAPGDTLRMCGNVTASESGRPHASLRALRFGGGPAYLDPCSDDSEVGKESVLCQQVSFLRDETNGGQESAIASSQGAGYAHARSIAVGDERTCVIVTEPWGAVRCWGKVLSAADEVPRDLPPVIALSAYGRSFCAITAMEGRVRCWGAPLSNIDGQPDMKNVVAISLGDLMACAVLWKTRNGKLNHGYVQCWGDSNSRAVDTIQPYTESQEPVVDVAVGRDHLCIHLAVGGLKCAGLYTVEGTGTEDRLASWPDRQLSLARAELHAVAGGSAFTCAAVHARGSGNSVQCWGSRFTGGTCAPHTCLPALLPTMSALSGGPEHVCGIVAATGAVTCWGDDALAPHMSPPPALPAVDQVATGEAHTCVVVAQTGGVQCWGSDDSGQSSVPAGLPPVLRSSDAIALEFVNDPPIAAARLGLKSHIWLYITGVTWGPNYVMIQRARIPAGADVSSGLYAMPHLYQGHAGLWVPTMQVAIQASPTEASTMRTCSSLAVRSAYAVQCYSDGLPALGGILRVWNGTGYSEAAFNQNSSLGYALTLQKVDAAASDYTQGMGMPQLSRASVAAGLTAALEAQSQSGTTGNRTRVSVSTSSIAVVRGGDTVTLLGAGFGAHAALVPEVPWWGPSVPGQLRSCIHLAWWASPASYHDDGACICNGQEDWLGEGELPLSSITAWNDTYIAFSVPPGDGIREVRPCVEGRGLTTASPRSSASFFLAYEPPKLTDLKPSAFVETTETEQTLFLALQIISAGDPFVKREWTHCLADVNVGLYGAQPAGVPPRLYLDPALPASQAFGRTRHCLSLPIAQDSLGNCWVSISVTTARALNTSLAGQDPLHVANVSNCQPSLFPVSPQLSVRRALGHAGEQGVQAHADETRMLAGGDGDDQASYIASAAVDLYVMPDSVPNAVLEVQYSVSVYDGGVWLSLPASLSSRTFRRTLPVLRSVNPNPLLLGGYGEAEGRPVTLTLYGLGFRTAEEVRDPRNGLTGLSPLAEVWVDGQPCSNVTVTRTDSRFAYVTCLYPASRAGGGDHEVVLQMVGVNTSLTPRDGTNAALRSTCATGYYGLFAEAQHKLCLPCPRGASCSGGLGLVPVAAPGFYNLGLPPGYSAVLGMPAGRNVSSLAEGVDARSVSCPPSAAPGGRGIACIVPCEPAPACLGDNQCAEGYVSLPPVFRCGQCAPGFYRSSGLCARCPVVGLASLILLVIVLLAAVAAMFLLSSASIRLCTLNMILEYLQILSLLSGPNLPWPTAVDKVMHSISLLRLNLEVSAPECYTSIELSPDAKLLIVLGMPLFVLAVGCTAYGAIALFKTCLHRGKAQGRASRSAGTRATGLVGKLSSLLNKGSVWSHGPPICRTVLKLLNSLYLPVIAASLEAWNCTPTDPPDGNEYLSIVFEQCGLPGGLQERMAPYSLLGLCLFGLLYPCLLACFYWRYRDLLVEDQLLKAAGTGDDRRSNPRCYVLRKHTSPLYVHFRPGYHWAGLLTMARRAFVCICALMLHKSPVLLSGGVVFVIAVGLTVTAIVQPFMTPGPGYAMALSEYGAKLAVGQSALHLRLQKHFAVTAAHTRIPVLLDLAAGKTGSWDAAAASRPWWSFAVDWNILEAELQLSVLLTGMLAIMYNAAQESVVYTDNVVPVVTGLFFLLLIVALCHILVTVSYDVLLQARWAVRDMLGIQHGLHATTPQEYEPGEAPVGLAKARLVPQRSDSVTDIAVELRQLFWLCCCPRSFNRAWASARAAQEEEEAARTAASKQATQQNGAGLDAADGGVVSEWSSPLNQHRGGSALSVTHPAPPRHLPVPSPHVPVHGGGGYGLEHGGTGGPLEPLEDPFSPVKPALSGSQGGRVVAASTPSPPDTSCLSPSSGSSDCSGGPPQQVAAAGVRAGVVGGEPGQGAPQSMQNPLRTAGTQSSHGAPAVPTAHPPRGPKGLAMLLHSQQQQQQ